MTSTFSSVGLTDALAHHLGSLGFHTPTPVQAQSITHILAGRDVCACAATGTGKTGAYLLPIIDVLLHGRTRSGMPRAIVLAPTRELAMQVQENFKEFAKGTTLRSALLVGGEWMNEQEKQLRRKPDIIIATPGRLLDVYERGKLLAHAIQFLVIDEADRMLDMGFMPDVNRIIAFCPKQRQIILFSATFPKEIQGLVTSVLTDPKRIEVIAPASDIKTITQHKIMVEVDQKRAAVRALLRQHANESAIVFCNRKRDVDIVAKFLTSHGLKGMAIHGDLSQNLRNETLNTFRGEDKGMILVASDVAARGIDIDELPLVINFDLPVNPEDYIHRIGRTGRAGHHGIAYSLVTSRDEKILKAITKLVGQEIPTLTLEIPDEEKKSSRSPKKGSSVESFERKRKEKVQEKEDAYVKDPAPKKRFPHGREREDDVKVLGFGESMPAFMKVDLSKYLPKSSAA